MTVELNILEGEAPSGPWMLAEPAVATFVLVGANEELMGIPEGLAAAIADCVGEAVDLDKPEATPPGVAWAAAIHVKALPAPLLCWPEAAAIDGTGLPENIEQRHGLVVQTLLHPQDPLTCLINVARLLAMIDPNAAGVLDWDTSRWLDRELLERDFLSDDTEPPEDVLWIVEAKHHETGLSVSSCGLARCGRMELHIEDVQETHVDAAADLVAALAALTLEVPLPPEGVSAEIGLGLHVQLRACEGGVTIIDANGDPPVDALQRLSEGNAAIYRTDRFARRHRAMAQATWSEFKHIALLGTYECLVEVPFEDPTGEEQRREHLWMRVSAVNDDTVTATPVHEASVATGVAVEAQTISPEEIASWRVIIDDEAWGPEQVATLLERITS